MSINNNGGFMTYSRYNDYRPSRLSKMPTRNLPTRIYQPLTQAVLELNWETSKEDSELNEFRYRVARTEKLLEHAKIQREIYQK